MTLFTSMDVLPYNVTCAVWDLFLVDGWKAVFRVALALLSLAEKDLLTEEFGIIVRYLNTFPRSKIPPARELLRLANSFKVTNGCVWSFVALDRYPIVIRGVLCTQSTAPA
jgi:ecotropic viral integration site 5 protein